MVEPESTDEKAPQDGRPSRAGAWLGSLTAGVRSALKSGGSGAGRYVVVFELRTKARYDEVAKSIALNPRSARVTAASWIVATEASAFELRDSLKPLLNGRGERLFVVAVAGSLAWTNLSEPAERIEALFKE